MFVCVFALRIIILQISLSLSLLHWHTFPACLSPLFLFLCITHHRLWSHSSLLPFFCLSLSLWLWCTNSLCTVTVIPGSLCLNSPLPVPGWRASTLWKKEKPSIIYNLSTVIFLVYSLFSGLLLPCVPLLSFTFNCTNNLGCAHQLCTCSLLPLRGCGNY